MTGKTLGKVRWSLVDNSVTVYVEDSPLEYGI